MVGAFLFTGVAASAITVFEGVTHVSLVGARLGGAKDIIRGGSTVGTANDMGFLLVKVLFIPLVLLLADRHALRRMLWLLLSGLVFGSILFIQTRAAYLAVALGMVLLFVYLPSRLRARVVVLALVGAVAFFSYPKSRDRMLTLLGYRSLEVDVGSARESVSKRAKMLYIGRDLWLEHPLTGVGINNVRYHMPRYGQRYAIAGASSTVVLENSFLQAAAETGLPGLLLFCGFFLVTLRYLHRALMRSRGSPEGLLVTGVGLGLVASLLFFFLSTLYEDNVFWAALAMVEILRRPSDPAAAAPQ